MKEVVARHDRLLYLQNIRLQRGHRRRGRGGAMLITMVRALRGLLALLRFAPPPKMVESIDAKQFDTALLHSTTV